MTGAELAQRLRDGVEPFPDMHLPSNQAPAIEHRAWEAGVLAGDDPRRQAAADYLARLVDEVRALDHTPIAVRYAEFAERQMNRNSVLTDHLDSDDVEGIVKTVRDDPANQTIHEKWELYRDSLGRTEFPDGRQFIRRLIELACEVLPELGDELPPEHGLCEYSDPSS